MDKKQTKRTSRSRWPSVTLRKASSDKPSEDGRPLSNAEPSEMAKINAEAAQRERDALLGDTEAGISTQSLDTAALSMVPDVANLDEDQLRGIPIARQKARYLIHDPLGPRWYKNHHLTPPTNHSRPPSALARKIGSSQNLVLLEDPPTAGSSRSPSGSPHGTPTSSQVRVAEANAGNRSRKVSQTAHDETDLMDGTDPHGTYWHHDSPYDVGLDPRRNEDRMIVSESEGIKRAGRRPMPSPLSQSTSALHQLAPTSPVSSQVSRKLSKRRTGMPSVFSPPEPETSRLKSSFSEPSGAIDDHLTPWTAAAAEESSPVTVTRKLSKRQSNINPAPPSISPSSISGPYPVRIPSLPPGQDKPNSYLERIIKKFSSARRRPVYVGPGGPINGRASGDWQRGDDATAIQSKIAVQTDQSDQPPISQNQMSSTDAASTGSPAPASPTKFDKTKSRRVPPPTLDGEEGLTSRLSQTLQAPVSTSPVSSPPTQTEAERQSDLSELKEDYQASNRASAPISIDTTPFSLGRLMIANPDAESLTNSPLKPSVALPEPVEEMPPPPPPRKLSTSPTKTSSTRVQEETKEHRRHASNPPTQLSAPVSEPKRQLTIRNSYEGELPESAPPPPPEKPPKDATTPLPRPDTSRPDNRRSSRLSGLEAPREVQAPATTQQQDRIAYLTPWTPVDIGASASRSTTSSMLVWPSSEATVSPRGSIGTVTGPYEESPLSRVSMMVNPPTPNTSSHDIAPSPLAQNVYTAPSINTHSSTHDSSRQTEKFRLVRSPSGSVVASPEVITAHGEQWEVVESSDEHSKPRERKRSKDRRSSSEGQSRHRSPVPSAPRRSGSKQSALDLSPSNHVRRESSKDLSAPSAPPRVPSKGHSSRRDKEKDKDRSSPTKKRNDGWYTTAPQSNPMTAKPSRDSSEPSSAVPDSTPPAAPSKGSQSSAESHTRPGAQLQRRKTRPTSDVPNTAEASSLKAREAWEAERLWKGRSGLYGSEATRFVATSPTGVVQTHAASIPHQPIYPYPVPVGMATVHGSSHTSFIVQAPHGHTPYVYATAPMQAPHMYYQPTLSSQPSSHLAPSHAAHHDYFNAHGSQLHPFPSSAASDPIGPDNSSYESPPNPLPIPPRPSKYKPSRAAAPSVPSSATVSGTTVPPPIDQYWAYRSDVATAR